MSEYAISEVRPGDRYMNDAVNQLLEQEGIRRDKNLDYTAAMLDDDYNVIATGSCFGNTLRCMAVSHLHQGEALMNDIVSHLVEYQYSRGNYHLFLYTKCNSAKFFGSLGFTEIARVPESNIVFMENKRTGFTDYLAALRKETVKQLAVMSVPDTVKQSYGTMLTSGTAAGFALSSSAPVDTMAAGITSSPEDIADISDQSAGSSARPSDLSKHRIGTIVMNANPFTLGHQYLVEQASKACDILHLFIVSEDSSLVPFSVRKKLVIEGTTLFPNIIYHDSGSYIISSSTFPAYFQKDADAVIDSEARLDTEVFAKIAGALAVTERFAGTEPTSVVTSAYNKIMGELLPTHGITFHEIPRKELTAGQPVSASTVRETIKSSDLDAIRAMVPASTFNWLTSEEAKPVIDHIRNTTDVKHY